MSGGVAGRTRTVTRRGLADRNTRAGTAKRQHRYLADPLLVDEAPANYHVEEGVLVDATEMTNPNRRKAYDEFTRYWPRTSDDLRDEEATWAAKSGPCVIIQQGRKTA